jgi:hypothetical protein
MALTLSGWLTDAYLLTSYGYTIWLSLEDEHGLGRHARPEPERAEQRRVLLRRVSTWEGVARHGRRHTLAHVPTAYLPTCLLAYMPTCFVRSGLLPCLAHLRRAEVIDPKALPPDARLRSK